VVGGLGKGRSFSDIIPSLDAFSFYYTIDETGKSVVMGKHHLHYHAYKRIGEPLLKAQTNPVVSAY
jgi:hypothetical protein